MSKKILHIDSSARFTDSESRNLSTAFINQWKTKHPGDEVIVRDIVSNPLPHLDEAMLGALFTPSENRTPEQQITTERVDELVDEFLAADVLVLGVPMYNFGIPSTLKSYIDHIAQAGRTFQYTENGPVGMAGGKTVYILSARGGVYDNSPLDHQVSYLKTVFGFLGIDQVDDIQAEGLNMGPEVHDKALASANLRITQVTEQSLAIAV